MVKFAYKSSTRVITDYANFDTTVNSHNWNARMENGEHPMDLV